MKKNLILLCSLFMATALISSCAQDAMEPEVDEIAAKAPETRAYGDKTPESYDVYRGQRHQPAEYDALSYEQ